MNTQHLTNRFQSAGGYPVSARLVFLHLLETDTDCSTKLSLCHVGTYASSPELGANVSIEIDRFGVASRFPSGGGNALQGSHGSVSPELRWSRHAVPFVKASLTIRLY